MAAAIIFTAFTGSVHAIDSQLTRQTLAGLQGVYLIVEELNPNIDKYTKKNNLTSKRLYSAVEQKLSEAGIRIFTWEQWLKAPRRPMLYVNVNTHPTQFVVGYDVRIELRQIVTIDALQVKTLAGTWSMNMTGVADRESLNAIKDNIGHLTDRFISAYKSVN
jgi:hypothetical protein